jgi:hypothetical protein
MCLPLSYSCCLACLGLRIVVWLSFI